MREKGKGANRGYVRKQVGTVVNGGSVPLGTLEACRIGLRVVALRGEGSVGAVVCVLPLLSA